LLSAPLSTCNESSKGASSSFFFLGNYGFARVYKFYNQLKACPLGWGQTIPETALYNNSVAINGSIDTNNSIINKIRAISNNDSWYLEFNREVSTINSSVWPTITVIKAGIAIIPPAITIIIGLESIINRKYNSYYRYYND